MLRATTVPCGINCNSSIIIKTCLQDGDQVKLKLAFSATEISKNLGRLGFACNLYT